MKTFNCMKWVCGLGVAVGLVSCNLDMPKETKSFPKKFLFDV